MGTTRRDFLRNTACALGGMALASTLESFSIVHALTPQAATDYRALVCIFMNGGNDGNNLLVSLDQYNDRPGAPKKVTRTFGAPQTWLFEFD